MPKKITCSKCGKTVNIRPDRLAAMSEEVVKNYMCKECKPKKMVSKTEILPDHLVDQPKQGDL